MAIAGIVVALAAPATTANAAIMKTTTMTIAIATAVTIVKKNAKQWMTHRPLLL